MTNAEKLASFVAKYGAESLLIHTVPGTTLWIVAQKKKDGWRMTLCNPLGTKSQIVGENITDKTHLALWKDLVKLETDKHINN